MIARAAPGAARTAPGRHPPGSRAHLGMRPWALTSLAAAVCTAALDALHALVSKHLRPLRLRSLTCVCWASTHTAAAAAAAAVVSVAYSARRLPRHAEEAP
jgi:hypothetical protein